MPAAERIQEKWTRIVKELSLDLTRPLNFVDASKVKEIAGEEPRIMAKMDSEQDLPAVFRENGVFVLPVTNRRYAIVRGRGYHALEGVSSALQAFNSAFPFDPVSPTVGQGEMQFVDLAHNAGLLEHFLGIDGLFLLVRGRKFSPAFDFRVGDSPQIHVGGVQVEIDGGFEGEHAFVALEAKVNWGGDFIVRQLYYPFRFWRETFRGKHVAKSVRPVFLVYDTSSSSYLLWEYEFRDPENYGSIELVRSGRYRLSWKPVDLRKLGAIVADTESPRQKIVPQADDVSKIGQLPFLVSLGHDTAHRVAEYFGFDRRQSSYYSQAAEALGLVELEGGRYRLTASGLEYMRKPAPRRNEILCQLMLKLPLFNEALAAMLLSPRRVVTRDELSRLIRKRGYSGSTLGRRTRTLMAWFEWMEATFGSVEVRKDEVSLDRRQQRFDV